MKILMLSLLIRIMTILAFVCMLQKHKNGTSQPDFC